MSKAKKIYVLNGPNLNLLGEREPDIYGNLSLKDIEKTLIDYAKDYDVEIYFKQSNHEGELIELVQEASKKANAIIINPAGYSHTSVALLDALLASNIPVLEVHISNIFKREDFRHNSYVSKSAIGVISGLGIDGYLYSLKFLLDYLKWWSFILTKNQIIDEEIRQAIKELSNMLEELKLTEIQIENDKFGKVRVARQNYISQISNFPNTKESSNNNDKPDQVIVNENDENIIKSPMVGTIYLQPEPGSDPFVKIGDKVTKGQTLLIVEAMKTMNDIVAEKDGTVKEIIVKNEQPVQFDDPLIIVE